MIALFVLTVDTKIWISDASRRQPPSNNIFSFSRPNLFPPNASHRPVIPPSIIESLVNRIPRQHPFDHCNRSTPFLTETMSPSSSPNVSRDSLPDNSILDTSVVSASKYSGTFLEGISLPKQKRTNVRKSSNDKNAACLCGVSIVSQSFHFLFISPRRAFKKATMNIKKTIRRAATSFRVESMTTQILVWITRSRPYLVSTMRWTRSWIQWKRLSFFQSREEWKCARALTVVVRLSRRRNKVLQPLQWRCKMLFWNRSGRIVERGARKWSCLNVGDESMVQVSFFRCCMSSNQEWFISKVCYLLNTLHKVYYYGELLPFQSEWIVAFHSFALSSW